MAMPLHGMLSRASSKVVRKNPASVRYQKTAATQQFLTQRAQMHQQSKSENKHGVPLVEPVQQKNEPPKQGLMLQPKIIDDKRQKFNIDGSSTPSKGSLGALLAVLGLGWLWSNTEGDEEKEKEPETTAKDMTFEEFVKRFAPPKEIRDTIDAHKDALIPCSVKPYLIKGTNPPIYHKCWRIDRIINAEMLREVIKQNNLDIELPNKYIYPNPTNGKYEIFVERVSARPLGDEQLTLKEIQQLATLAVEARYTDFNKDNVLRNPKNNKLVIIDTEEMSFYEGASKVRALEFLILRFDRGDLKVRKDARTWVFNYLRKLQNTDEGQEVVSLYTLPRYNRLNISAENTKQLQRDLYKQHHEQDKLAAKVLWYIKHGAWPK